jgi:hypothetical protein
MIIAKPWRLEGCREFVCEQKTGLERSIALPSPSPLEKLWIATREIGNRTSRLTHDNDIMMNTAGFYKLKNTGCQP